MRTGWMVVAALALGACEVEEELADAAPGISLDGGADHGAFPDGAAGARTGDAQAADRGVQDQRVPDRGGADGAVSDRSVADGAPLDLAVPDAAPEDLSLPGAAPVDLAVADAVPADLAVPDAVPVDLAVPDAVPVDQALPDAARPVDADGDGHPDRADCAPADPARHPGAEEVCDGADNDCDGSTDEGVENPCGGCGAVPAEVCDGADNDCDGSTDEGVQNDCGACGAVPGEVCDGADNDCDGSVDEGVQNPCGACGDVPAEVCDGADTDCDVFIDEGVPNRCGGCGPLPAEVCNGLDDDCDGRLDERPLTACDAGQGGACANGWLVCEAGGERCRPRAADQDERCNGADDDCDGAVDEGLPINACGTGCRALPPDRCDGLDSDCDGAIDEDCPTAALEALCAQAEGGIDVQGCDGPAVDWPALECPQGPARLEAVDALPVLFEDPWRVYYAPNGGDDRPDQWSARLRDGAILSQTFGGGVGAMCTRYDYNADGQVVAMDELSGADPEAGRPFCDAQEVFIDCGVYINRRAACTVQAGQVVGQSSAEVPNCDCNACRELQVFWMYEAYTSQRLVAPPDGPVRAWIRETRAREAEFWTQTCEARLVLRDAQGRVVCDASGDCDGLGAQVTRYRYAPACDP